MNPTGKWEGKLLDMSGPVALVTLNLVSRGTELTGDFAMSFLALDEGGCCGPSRQLSQVGQVSGRLDMKTGLVRLNYNVTVGREAVAVTFEGTMTKADPHARRALLGCYSVGKGTGLLTLEGGACILWLYAEQRQARRGNNG